MPEYETPPIKRHDALVPLSRDHDVGLVHAHRLMKAASKDRVARHKAPLGRLILGSGVPIV